MSDDPSAYIARRRMAGCTLERAGVEGLAADWQEEGIIPKADISSLSDDELLRHVWASSKARGMDIAAIDLHATISGRGVTAQIGGPEWPYRGIKGSYSVFSCPKATTDPKALRSLEASGKAAFIALRVQFADGYWGHLRFNCIYIDGQGWQPISVGVASTNPDKWPSPHI